MLWIFHTHIKGGNCVGSSHSSRKQQKSPLSLTRSLGDRTENLFFVTYDIEEGGGGGGVEREKPNYHRISHGRFVPKMARKELRERERELNMCNVAAILYCLELSMVEQNLYYHIGSHMHMCNRCTALWFPFLSIVSIWLSRQWNVMISFNFARI